MYAWERVKQRLSEAGGSFCEPPREDMGDLSTSAAFKIAKEEGREVLEVASEIRERVERLDFVERAEVVRGYVNVFLDRRRICELVLGEASREDYGRRSAGEGRTVVIDYSSPNVAKPMHVGHLRSTVIGGSLCRLYSFLGYRVVGINYLGDVGTQFGKLIYAYKRWVDREALRRDPIKELLRIYVKFHEEAEKRPELEDEAREEYRKLEEGDEENVRLWREFRELSIESFRRVYELFGIEFEEFSGESFYVERAKELAQELLKAGIAKVWDRGEKKGAIVADLEEYGLDHPVLLKSDGTTIYLSRDLAALVDRCEKYRFYRAIYVVGREQKLHFKQLFKIAELMGLECGGLYHLSFGHLKLPEGALSTRKGRVVFAEEVLERAIELAREEIRKRWGEVDEGDAVKIGVGAVVYAILKVEPEKDIVFDWSKVLAFEGDAGPYLQYSLVRAKKILEKASDVPSFDISRVEVGDPEWTLVKEIAKFPEIVLEAAETMKPYVLARYARVLADKFNKFYEKCPVIRESGDVKGFRLSVVGAFYNTMRNALRLLLIQEPERM